MARADITPTLLKRLYYKKQLSKKEIALRLNCNIITIHNKMKKFSIPARNRIEAVRIAMQKREMRIPRPQLRNLYRKESLSIAEIARELKLDRATIKRELQRNKIPLRTTAEAIRLYGQKTRIQESTLLNLYYRDHLTQKQIGERLNKSRGYITVLMKKYKLRTRTPDYYHTRYPKYDFSKDSQEKAYLIGFRTGDLHVYQTPSRKLIRVDCTSTKQEQIKLFKDLFRKYGHIWVSKQRKDGNRTFCVFLNHSFKFLLLKHNNISRWIQNDDNYFLSFLAGYIDAEGCIWSSGNQARLAIASYDRNILRQIYTRLSKRGLPCNPPRILVRQGHVKTNGQVYKNDHWCFTISKKSSLVSILTLLEKKLKHQKRLQDLKKARRNIKERNQRLFLKRSRRYRPV